jgi:hypothetical protein
MISLIDDLAPLETSLLKKLIPAAATADLKPLNWETAGADIYIPMWRKQVAPFLSLLSTKKLSELPTLVLNLRALAIYVPHPPGVRLNQGQQDARALDVLTCAFALCLFENGWKLIVEPGNLALESGETKIGPGGVVGTIRAGKLTIAEWSSFCAQRGIGDWPLVSSVPAPATL